nr:MAG TPA: hypothetical protein [Caudoviricetes sp.]DAR92614.1 MAG TPA: hypothetical protein [Bacteriophage sp.]
MPRTPCRGKWGSTPHRRTSGFLYQFLIPAHTGKKWRGEVART